MKKIYLFITILFIIFPISNAFCETIKCPIIGTSNDKLYVATGENIILDANKTQGIILGDILSIIKKDDTLSMIGEIGKCAIIKIDDTSGICNIIESKAEIGKGDFAVVKIPEYKNPQLYPLIYKLNEEIVEPFENHKRVKVYVHNIYDDKSNITALSELLKDEIINVFYQKKRLIVDIESLNKYLNYPDHYFYIGTTKSKKETVNKIRNIMQDVQIDIVVMGTYKIEDKNIKLELYLINKISGLEKKMDFLLDLNGFSNIAKQIVVPYKLIKEKEFVNYSIVYKQKDYFPSKYEQYEIIKAESNKELSFKYNFMDGKLKFNRISPGDITIKINTTTLNDIQKGDIYEKMFEKGMKRLLVSFVPTLYDNDNEIFELKRVIKKEVILDLKDEESIFLDIMLDATYEKEHIDLKITKNIYDEKFVIKPIMNEFIKKQRIDVYRD